MSVRKSLCRLWACAFLMIPIGCQQPAPQTENRTAPATQPVLSSYAYPADPPVVHQAALRAFLGRFSGHPILVYTWSQQQDLSPRLAWLAKCYDQNRENGLKVVSLYLGSPDDWKSVVVPLLRKNQANYACVVVPPDYQADIVRWLNRGESGIADGYFLLDAQGRPAQRWHAQEPMSRLESILREPMPEINAASAPRIQAGASLIDVKTGETLSTASASAMNMTLIDEIADTLSKQLFSQLNITRRDAVIAVLPLHERTVESRHRKAGLAVANKIFDYLRSRHDAKAVGPEKAQETLRRIDVNPLAIEFDLHNLPADSPWQYLITGWISINDGNLQR